MVGDLTRNVLSTTMVYLNLFYQQVKAQLCYWQMFFVKFHPFEVVGHGSETQLPYELYKLAD